MNETKPPTASDPAVGSRDLLAEALRERYTLMKPCVVGGEPDLEEPEPHTVWLKVGVQSFCLDGYRGTKEEAEWTRNMLSTALATLVREQSANDKAETSATRDVLDENRRLREALQSILDSMEQMPQLNEAIVEEIMRGDHTLECEIGGDEANISSWVAIARMALSSNAELSDRRGAGSLK